MPELKVRLTNRKVGLTTEAAKQMAESVVTSVHMKGDSRLPRQDLVVREDKTIGEFSNGRLITWGSLAMPQKHTKMTIEGMKEAPGGRIYVPPKLLKMYSEAHPLIIHYDSKRGFHIVEEEKEDDEEEIAL